ncbi:hypothetical protein, partial [Actinoplanes sp. NPDC026670]|uniref:hypothetical protein n=1 Tax=Actinoplanes sp. NPDC026670 TaxID=3154700 RepID=UPI0033D3C4E7
MWFVVQGPLRGEDLAAFFPSGHGKGCKIGARVNSTFALLGGRVRVAAWRGEVISKEMKHRRFTI